MRPPGKMCDRCDGVGFLNPICYGRIDDPPPKSRVRCEPCDGTGTLPEIMQPRRAVLVDDVDPGEPGPAVDFDW